MQHFLTTEDLPLTLHAQITRSAIAYKTQSKEDAPLKGKTFVLLFQKPSTRTRIAFETAILQLGGNCIFMTEDSSQLSRGETIRDTARVLSSMVQGIIIRTHSHRMLEEFARHSNVPVINALSPQYHPCQLLADVMTFHELRGNLTNRKVVWCGDGNNVCRSYMQTAALYGFQLYLATPFSYLPPRELLDKYKEHLVITEDPASAMKDADLVCTDVWVSMGDGNAERKSRDLKKYQVTRELLNQAKDAVLFMHCLPAQEGKEISRGLLDDPRSAVWQQAENRLHSQKALLRLLCR